MNDHNDTHDTTLPAPWGGVPMIDAPTPTERGCALDAYPSDAHSQGEAVPDPSYLTSSSTTIEVPD